MMRMAGAAEVALGTQVSDAFRANERFLWGLCYRMTGSAADADDLVQETFVRALARPPANREEPWRPWLVRVVMNLARDALRRRRRRAYVGPWLPTPIETEDEPPAHEPVVVDSDGRPLTTEGRYDLMESVSFGFLLALEALTPRQRAVLLLRDVFEYDVAETALALGLSEANVRTTHHRARHAMHEYDRTRTLPDPARRSETAEMLARLLGALRGDDPRAAEALLAADVRALNDGGGEFLAARKPIVGSAKVALFYRKISRAHAATAAVRPCVLNGLPALLVDNPDAPDRVARRFTISIELDGNGRIRRLYNVLATPKLARLRVA
jgi:RNA polymerase sigma-70 factor (ECF subfamily)